MKNPFHLPIEVFCLGVMLWAGTLAAHAQEQRFLKVVDIADEPHHTLLLENEKTRVWKLELKPGEESTLVKHEYAYAMVGLRDAELESYDRAGRFPEKLWFPGYTKFFNADIYRGIRNSGESYFEAIVVEVKAAGLMGNTNPTDPTDVRAQFFDEFPAPLEPNKTFSVHRLSVPVVAGLSQILPGEATQWQAYAGPQLLVAVTDAELRSESETEKPAEIEVQRGDIAWVRAQGKRRLRNWGKYPAVVVAMEWR